MKSILMALILVSAGTASVAGLSLGVPDDLVKGLPRLGGTPDDAFSASDARALPTLSKRPRVEPVQADKAEAASTAVEVAQAETGQTSGQTTGQTSGQTSDQPEAAAGTETRQAQVTVDESALRYFAARGDTARLNAEIARLRALYPTWMPPENPLAVPVNEDRQLEEMWALYSQSRYADVRAAIAKRQQEDPQWTPPADLVERLDVAEKRAELVTASNEKRNEDVVRLGAETPSLLTCMDADVLWRVAEAFVRTDRVQRAKDAYGYMLDNCTEAPIRIATVQKASTLLGYADMQDLLARERAGADGVMEFETIRNDLARRFVAEADEDTSITVAPNYLKLVEKLVADEGLASDALLLGWYHLRREQNAAAEPYFRKARAIEDSAPASQGLALILLARKLPLEAEDVMYAWRTTNDQAMQTYLAATTNLLAMDPPPRLEPKVLNRIAEVTLERKHPETGEQFGWYALAMNQPQTAEEWFALVLKWKTDYEPAAYGLAVARLRLEDREGLAAVKQAWSSRSERVAKLGEDDAQDDGGPAARGGQRRSDIEPAEEVRGARTERRVAVRERVERVERVAMAPQRTVRTVRRPQGAGCRTTRDPSGLPPAAALSLGWCLMEINRPLEAAQAFETALRGGGRTQSDAAYGQSLAYLRAGLTSDAAVAATKAQLDGRRGAELQSAILADRAVSSFRAQRYRETIGYLDQRSQFRPEPTDLMVLRAYSYKSLGMRADAFRLLEALSETGRQDAIRALAEMRAERDGRQ
jgi:tetratricopeptide (TPR) repeat protein